MVNLDKSEVSFGQNVSDQLCNMLRGSLGFKAVETHTSYLGLPTYIGRNQKAVFSTIQDWVWKKIKGRKEKFLSKAGKEILLKTVMQAIPTYAMQCFKIPKSV